MMPTGASALALAMALRTSSMLRPMEASSVGLTRTRMAGCSAPLTVTSATPVDLRDALRDDGVGGVVDGARPACVFDVSARISTGAADGIGLAERRQRRQVARQVGGGGVERRLHVARGAVDVAGEVELDGDAGRAQRADRGHLGDAGDLAEPPLERRGDGRRHGLGIGARPARLTRMVGNSTAGRLATGR